MSDLLSVPGASNTLLEATVPYSRESQKDLLGHDPDQFVSAAHARDLAHVAYRRAAQLAPPGVPVVSSGFMRVLDQEHHPRLCHQPMTSTIASCFGMNKLVLSVFMLDFQSACEFHGNFIYHFRNVSPGKSALRYNRLSLETVASVLPGWGWGSMRAGI